MKNKSLIKRPRLRRVPIVDETLKTTSLFYLQDAIINERYEQAAEQIVTARGFGASDQEVKSAIAEALGEKKGGIRANEAGPFKNRLQF